MVFCISITQLSNMRRLVNVCLVNGSLHCFSVGVEFPVFILVVGLKYFDLPDLRMTWLSVALFCQVPPSYTGSYKFSYFRIFDGYICLDSSVFPKLTLKFFHPILFQKIEELRQHQDGGLLNSILDDLIKKTGSVGKKFDEQTAIEESSYKCLRGSLC